MRFTTSGPEVTPPEDLAVIDDRLGSNTQEAYVAAVHTAPHLEGLLVISDDSTGPYFMGGGATVENCFIGINSDPDLYRAQIDTGWERQRNAKAAEVCESKGIEAGIPETAVIHLLHEMGHADYWFSYLADYRDDPYARIRQIRTKRNAELAALPLGMSTSKALELWNTNHEGYRDRFYASGKTDKDWGMLCQANLQAYAEVTTEKKADTFALGVLATASA